MKRERQSNWELLRIFAMLAIVSGHFIGQSGAAAHFSGAGLYLMDVLGHGSRIAVSLFLMLGVWFMVDAPFHGRRPLKLYGQTVFYTMSVCALMLLLGEPVSRHDMVGAVFPISFAVWFAGSYLVLVLVSPWLHRLLEWPRQTLRNFLLVLAVFIIGITSIHKMEDTWLCTLIWFMYTYLCVGYYKRYLAGTWTCNKWVLLCAGGGHTSSR